MTTTNKSRPVIRAVAFDLDGLMFNTEDVFQRAGHELLQRRNQCMTDELTCRMMGRRAPEAFAAMVELCRLTEPVESLMAESRQIFFDLLPSHLAPMPGLFELLAHIEAHHLPKGVATSSERVYLEDILIRFELLDRFDMTLAAEDVTHGKPHPEIYRTSARRLGVAPAEMLVLEDSEAGTRAAAAAGAVVVSVPHEHSRRHDFRAAAHVVTCLNDPRVFDLIAR